MENDFNTIDDRPPFDLSKSLDWNITSMKDKMIRDGMTPKEADEIIAKHYKKYFNEDGTRKDGKDRI